MQPYRYKVSYIPGSRNIADSLSRLLSCTKHKETIETKNTESYVRFIAQIATPNAMTTRDIERHSENDPELQEIRKCLLDGMWHNIECKEYLPVRGELCAIGKLVLRGTRIVVPKDMRQSVLELAHEGHPGIVGMKQRVRTKVWWPGIDKQVENYCKQCYGCQLVGQATKPEPMKRTELPSGPWQHISADLLGPLPSGDYIFVLVDYYSRWFELEFTKSTTSERITQIMSKMFVTHGLPISCRTDNGPQFISDHFKQFMLELGIKHHKVTPLWPQANGEVERQNRWILKRLRIAQVEGRNWQNEIDKYLLMYRSTPHTVTGVSPAELLFKRKIRTKLPELQDFNADDLDVRDRDSEKKEKGKIYSDQRRGAKENDIKPGDRVLIQQPKRNKLTTRFNPIPCVVKDKIGNSVIVECDGVHYKRNITQVKKFLENVDTKIPDKVVEPDIWDEDDVYEHDETVIDLNQSNDAGNDLNVNDAGNDLNVNEPMAESDMSIQNAHSETGNLDERPKRVKKIPSKYKDFIVD